MSAKLFFVCEDILGNSTVVLPKARVIQKDKPKYNDFALVFSEYKSE